MDVTLHQYLKDSTRAKHSQAEGHPFQGALAQGKLPLDGYCAYLVQLRALHERIEAKIAAQQASDKSLASVVVAEHFQLPFIEKDLLALNIKPDAAPVFSCVQEFCDLPAFSKTPVSLLGPLYVLLGSKHGAKFIAHHVKDAYALSDGGYSYFNPYGENFRELWQQFTSGLNSLQLTAEEREAVLQGANETFDVFGRIGEEIWRSLGAKAPVTS